MSTNAKTLDNLSFDQLVPGGSKYLRQADVTEDGLVVTIKGFKVESVKGDDGDEDKTVMYFEEDLPPMILNRTNASLLSVCTGAKTAGEAKGKKITVYADPTVSFGGRVVGGLRIRKAPGAPKAAAPVRDGVPFNDEVPF